MPQLPPLSPGVWLETIYVAKTLFCFCTVSKLPQLYSSHRLPGAFCDASAKCSTRVAPAPYSLTQRYRGSPCRRAILHVDDAWAANACNRCHPMRPDPPVLCAWSRVGVGEAAGVTLTREQGAAYPPSDWRFKRQNKAGTNLSWTIFLFWHQGSREIINGWMLEHL